MPIISNGRVVVVVLKVQHVYDGMAFSSHSNKLFEYDVISLVN